MNKSHHQWIWLAAVILALSAGVLALQRFSINSEVVEARAETKTIKAAPTWELKDINGKVVKSSDFNGKVVILDFWATWCPPCRKEIPGFIELQKQYEKAGLMVVGISLDEEGPAVVEKFMKSNGINYPVVMGTTETVEAFGGIEGIPTTFIIDRKGNLRGKHVGFVEKRVFESEITPLLKEKVEQSAKLEVK